ncbi:hypothetical protein RDWZM_000077 [Blomia tropicalis]|uniref:TIL domain-containing protein n=1 Tax=Blomia tropicalis TaxID=40697 RepID=A0A9Q0MBJ3_BLOTA|nr:hypothetical protein RDWZM_000077 [Blomia tropicalis]
MFVLNTIVLIILINSFDGTTEAAPSPLEETTEPSSNIINGTVYTEISVTSGPLADASSDIMITTMASNIESIDAANNMTTVTIDIPTTTAPSIDNSKKLIVSASPPDMSIRCKAQSEIHSNCSNSCPASCEEPTRKPCRNFCWNGCECAPGYVKTINGNVFRSKIVLNVARTNITVIVDQIVSHLVERIKIYLSIVIIVPVVNVAVSVIMVLYETWRRMVPAFQLENVLKNVDPTNIGMSMVNRVYEAYKIRDQSVYLSHPSLVAYAIQALYETGPTNNVNQFPQLKIDATQTKPIHIVILNVPEIVLMKISDKCVQPFVIVDVSATKAIDVTVPAIVFYQTIAEPLVQTMRRPSFPFKRTSNCIFVVHFRFISTKKMIE